MCTLTWWSHPEGYDVFFNRDERKSRLPALPPSVHKAENGTRFLAAIDGNAGGTWLFGNEHGLCIAILNFYEKETSGGSFGAYRSRGLLVSGLAGCDSLEAVAAELGQLPLEFYQAFTLLAFSGPSGFQAWRWKFDGETLDGPTRNPSSPVCSSSFLSREVVTQREILLREMRSGQPENAGPNILDAYHHHDNGGNPSAHTVKMNRPDAQTWSISRITVTPASVNFAYEALPPDHQGESAFANAEISRHAR